MNRKELMAAVALAAGISLGVAAPSTADHKDSHQQVAQKGPGPMGFIRSDNPRAAGGAENPGQGNPWWKDAY